MTPSRNNRGVAHENGAIESAHGHLRRALLDALLLRGTAAFDDLVGYRRFVDELLGRRNRRNAARIDAERAHLQAQPDRRSCDYEETVVAVYLQQRLYLAQGVLLRVLASDRSPPARPLHDDISTSSSAAPG